MLDIDPVLLFGSSFLFLVVLFLLNKMLFQPILHHMDSRDENIKNQQAQNRNTDEELQLILDQANDILRDAKLKSQAINQTATTEANKEADKRYQEAQAKQVKKMNRFQATYNENKTELENSLKKIELEVCEQINDKIKSA